MGSLAFIENLSIGEVIVIMIVMLLILGPSAARRAGRFVGTTTSGGGSNPQTPPPSTTTTVANTLDESYRALDLAPGAGMEQIRAAYKELVKVWHPDRFGQDEKLRERATQKLQQINAAYEKLCRAHDTHSQN
jgi:DnaJ-domain-containing protein 1